MQAPVAIEQRSESWYWKRNNSNTASSVKPNIVQQKYWKQKQAAIADYVENLRQNDSHYSSVPNIGKRYIKQRDRVFAQQHFNICKAIWIKLDRGQYYDRSWVPKSITTSNESNVHIPWNQKVKTDRTLPNNKPDIIVRDNEKRNMSGNRYCNFRRQKFD